MPDSSWQFSIDVGGTFTDVIARRPDGSSATCKLLSTGVVRGVIEAGSTPTCIVDKRRLGEAPDLWRGYRLRVARDDADCRAASTSNESIETTVSDSDGAAGTIALAAPLALYDEHTGGEGTVYELSSGEPAPVVAIRLLMGRKLDEPIGPIDVRLGTTRATNALLERKGARTAFVTTRGFADAIKIGHQDRPDLFALNIIKRDELAERVIEIDERLAADGSVLRAIDRDRVAARLRSLRAEGIESLAICLLHAHVNPEHEEQVARIAEPLGFTQVSVSSRVARLEGFVSRGDTTVADAYLAPVIRAYVGHIRQALPDARIKLMTSSGGLVDAGQVSGIDTILSGPAGGVVGCRSVAVQCGATRVIGFDMGGTSTDVTRIDLSAADIEYQHETVKAGVRLRAPMLPIETVAAGGGSICGFDGQMLTVGPASAGADPGPACYGRGGPLTVSDVNLFLGRIVSSSFPFPLDGKAVRRRLEEVRAEVIRGTGSSLSVYELADGFRCIANEHMAAAIKRVSLQRGYDLREYALVTFGGAGGQHACALAHALGIRRIICHKHAGILSAVGLAAATVSRIEQRAVCEVVDDSLSSRLDPIIRELIEAVNESLLANGVRPSALGEPRVSLDVCYQGQSTLLTVPFGSAGEIGRGFARLHEQLYGYVHEGRPIEVRVVRVERAARADGGDGTEVGCGRGESASDSVRPAGGSGSNRAAMYVDGSVCDVPLYERAQLAAGAVITGPAIVAEATGTIVIDRGWEGRVASSDLIELTRVDIGVQSVRPLEASCEADPIQLELFNRRFAAVAEQMGTTLQRTALSTNVKERLDFSCAVFDPKGNLIANAPHIPVHLGGMSDCVRCLVEEVGPFEPGDVYVTNDPFRGGSHLNDVTVITPVFDESGAELLFIVANRAHHAEIGGIRPGSMAPDAASLAQEGVLIRAMRIMQQGVSRLDELRHLLGAAGHPSRAPDENLADIEAQIAANRTGHRALTALVDQCGASIVHAYMRHIRKAAELKTRSAIRALPDGVRRFEDRMDDGTRIRLKLSIDGDLARFDFTGTDPVCRGNLNANPSIVRSAVLYCLRCLIAEEIPLNGGMLAPIDIILPECFLNPPAHEDPRDCAAVGGGNVETSQRVVDVILGAFGVAAASQGTMNNVLLGNDRFGYYETICGGSGAGPGFDGADAVHTHMTNTRLTDPEILESRYPLRLVRFSIRKGSGGAGRYGGGCGVVRELEFLEPLSVSLLTQRRHTVPYGASGGSAGSRGRNALVRGGTGETIELAPIESLTVQAGDRLVIETPGGGGWGRQGEVESQGD